MNFKTYAIDFVIMFAIVLVVNLLVTFLYSLLVHGSGVVDWETAFQFAFSLAIILPWIRRRESKQN